MKNNYIAHKKAHDIFWSGIKESPELEKWVIDFLNSDNNLECSPDFLGFLGTYYYLSKIIPQDRVVYDLGCCNGFQAWFFKHHLEYIGVDLLTKPENQLKTSNSQYFHTDIDSYLKTTNIKTPHFAICNYVPPWRGDNQKLVRENFRHIFVYYPESKNKVSLL